MSFDDSGIAFAAGGQSEETVSLPPVFGGDDNNGAAAKFGGEIGLFFLSFSPPFARYSLSPSPSSEIDKLAEVRRGLRKKKILHGSSRANNKGLNGLLH